MSRSAALLDSIPLPPLLVRARAKRALRRRLGSLAAAPDQDPRLLRRARLEKIALQPWETSTRPRLCWGDLPLEFWQRVLGARLHVGTALWPRWARDLDQAETEWCQAVAERLAPARGHRVLEIGVLPGAFARWAEVERPGLDVTLLPCGGENRSLLDLAVAELGPVRAELPRATLADYAPAGAFDRILLVEGLTRSANPGPLLDRAISWLAPGGRLLLQIACHWSSSYGFEPGDENGWMLPEVPDGALHPGQEYLDDLIDSRQLLRTWELSGEHYERTARAWRKALGRSSEELIGVLAASGDPHPVRTLRAWRDALLALETTYGFRRGQEWCVTQLLLGGRPREARPPGDDERL